MRLVWRFVSTPLTVTSDFSDEVLDGRVAVERVVLRRTAGRRDVVRRRGLAKDDLAIFEHQRRHGGRREVLVEEDERLGTIDLRRQRVAGFGDDDLVNDWPDQVVKELLCLGVALQSGIADERATGLACTVPVEQCRVDDLVGAIIADDNAFSQRVVDSGIADIGALDTAIRRSACFE